MLHQYYLGMQFMLKVLLEKLFVGQQKRIYLLMSYLFLNLNRVSKISICQTRMTSLLTTPWQAGSRADLD